MRRSLLLTLMTVVALLAAGCGGEDESEGPTGSPATEAGDEGSSDRDAGPETPERDAGPETPERDAGEGRPEEAEPVQASPADPRPDWLGQRVLPEGPDGFGEIRPTPPELADRRLATPDHLPPPGRAAFAADVSAVPEDVAARSTWSPECPVGLDELRYVTVSFWGFDERPHTGELLVHHSVAEDVVGVFRRLYEARFPIEEMRITPAEELDAPPTGDGNNTGAFVCRPSTGSSSWSEHARGLAVDINPFHNPYVKGELVVPELSSAYKDRADHRPGMIQPGDEAVSAFADIGWTWGGDWSSAKDWMHFSQSGK